MIGRYTCDDDVILVPRRSNICEIYKLLLEGSDAEPWPLSIPLNITKLSLEFLTINMFSVAVGMQNPN